MMNDYKESLTRSLLAGNAGDEEWESTTGDLTHQNDAVESTTKPRWRRVWSRPQSRATRKGLRALEGGIAILSLLLLLNLAVAFLSMSGCQPMTDAECGAQVSLWCEFLFCFVLLLGSCRLFLTTWSKAQEKQHDGDLRVDMNCSPRDGSSRLRRIRLRQRLRLKEHLSGAAHIRKRRSMGEAV